MLTPFSYVVLSDQSFSYFTALVPRDGGGGNCPICAAPNNMVFEPFWFEKKKKVPQNDIF